jgi:hypothetical protein
MMDYLHFSPIFNSAAEQVRRLHWSYHKLDGRRLHMPADQQAVCDALIKLAEAM